MNHLRPGHIRPILYYLTAFIAAIITICAPLHARAATGLQPSPKVSFTFDDGLTSALNKAAPTLAKYGYTGTSYAISGCVQTTNTCPADPDASYMSWNQLTTLKNAYGWEIGSHSVTHPLMTEISAANLEKEVANSKQTFASHGFNTTAFATPYGDYNNQVKAAIAKYYTSHRPFADQQFGNDWPYNDYLLYVKQVQVGVSVTQVKTYIDQAKQNNQWLVLVFHGIADNPSSNPDDYQYSTGNLDAVAAYAKSQGLANTNVSDGLVTGDTNLLAGGGFDNGLTNGWTTDNTAVVKRDTSSKGSFPGSQNSISMVAATKSVHLFSPKVAVAADKSYVIKSYLNLQRINSGEVTYYIDEYDAAGNWISGQYKLGERNSDAGNVNLGYAPTSANVKQASLQLAVSANSGIRAYVDNAAWYQR